MTRESPKPRLGMTRLEIAVVVIVIGSLMGLVGFLPGIILLLLSFGWIFYPFQVAGEITIEPIAVLTSLLALIFFTWGVNSFGKWLARETSTEERPRTWTVKKSLQFVVLILFAFVAGTSMIGIVHQVTWLATTDKRLLGGGYRAARRSSSKNNLKQTGLAQHKYHDTHQQLATSTFLVDGRSLHSCQTFLLPHIDQPYLYEQIDLDLPWSHPDNAKIFRKELPVYLNPGIDYESNPDEPAPSHYASNIRVLTPSGKVSLSDITDGSSNTILTGEVIENFKAWGDPTNLRDPAQGINHSPTGFGSPFQGGAQFLFADGSVRFLSEEIDPKVLKALATPRGREEIPNDF